MNVGFGSIASFKLFGWLGSGCCFDYVLHNAVALNLSAPKSTLTIRKPLCHGLLRKRYIDWSLAIGNYHDPCIYLLFLKLTPFVPNWFINIGEKIEAKHSHI